MKKGTIIAVIVIVLAVVAAACVFGFFAGKTEQPPTPPSTGEPNQTDTPSTPDTPDTPSTPDQPDEESGEPTVVYVPDEQGESLTPVGTDVEDDSDQALVDALIAVGSLPEGVAVNNSSLADGTLTLDMNAAYGQAVRSSGTTGESNLIYALVNTFAQARGANNVLITVDGAPLESGHDIYDYPLEPNA